MADGGGTAARSMVAILLSAALVAGCSTPPISQAVPSTGPAPSAAVETGVPPASPTDVPSPAGASPTGTPATATTPAPVLPDKPAAVTFTEVGHERLGRGRTRIIHRVAWAAPDDAATSITVVGVTACLREGRRFQDQPCLVKGMRIPKRVQEVLARVPASERSVDISWTVGEAGPGPYFSVLVRASNAAGDSIFTIAWSETVCWQCTY